MMKKAIFGIMIGLVISVLLVSTTFNAAAEAYKIGDQRVHVTGLISQTVMASIESDSWDTQEGVNQALTNIVMEGSTSFSGDLHAYGALGLTYDWAYDINSGDDDWKRKGFNESDHLKIDDEWWQIVKEAHFTWTPGNFMFRIGKQRVGWGEMLAFAVNDVIDPLDYARAYGEVELETIKIATPLVRMDYYPEASMGWLKDLVLQFVFNPNVDHIPQNGAYYWLGNDAAGVWALEYPGPELVNDTVLGVGVIDRPTLERAAELFDPTGAFGLLPAVQALPTLATTRVGRWDLNLEEPDDFDSDFFEYGLKLQSRIGGSLFSVMGFYGRERVPVTTPGEAFAADALTRADDDGNLILNLLDRGFYPRQKFVGVAFQTTLPFRVPSLGGVEPSLSLEAKYQMDKVYMNAGKWLDEFILLGVSNFKSNLVESDYFVGGINVEYKIKPLLPYQDTFFYIAFEANYNNILDHEESWQVGDKEWWNYYAVLDTGWLNGKLRPGLAFLAETDGDIKMLQPSLTYVYRGDLTFLVKASFFGSSDFVPNKDNIVFKVTYTF